MKPRRLSSEQVTGTARCDRCRRLFREETEAKRSLWSVQLEGRAVVGFRCPRCRTAEEGTGDAIRVTTLMYDRDHAGRTLARPMASADE